MQVHVQYLYCTINLLNRICFQIQCNFMHIGKQELRLAGSSSRPQGRAPGSIQRVFSDSSTDAGSATSLASAAGSTRAAFVPYCDLQMAHLSYHGHRDSVRFFLAVPGLDASASRPLTTRLSSDITPTSPPRAHSPEPKYLLVISGGQGYIDFRSCMPSQNFFFLSESESDAYNKRF